MKKYSANLRISLVKYKKKKIQPKKESHSPRFIERSLRGSSSSSSFTR